MKAGTVIWAGAPGDDSMVEEARRWVKERGLDGDAVRLARDRKGDVVTVTLRREQRVKAGSSRSA